MYFMNYLANCANDPHMESLGFTTQNCARLCEKWYTHTIYYQSTQPITEPIPFRYSTQTLI